MANQLSPTNWIEFRALDRKPAILGIVVSLEADEYQRIRDLPYPAGGQHIGSDDSDGFEGLADLQVVIGDRLCQTFQRDRRAILVPETKCLS